MLAELVLNTLRAMPEVRGKKRVARMLIPHSVRAQERTIQDSQGNRMVLPNLLNILGECLAVEGWWERELLEFLEQRLDRNSVFVDVGANIGATTVPLARKVARVIAIEPSPKVLPYLRRNVALNGLSNVAIVECAASLPGSSSIPLYMPPMENFGMGSTAPQFGVEPIMVPAFPLDSILEMQGVSHVNAMKLDVEGYEAHVFLGAERLLSRGTAIIFEFVDWTAERAFPGRAGWAQQILLDAGYKLWSLPDFLKGADPFSAPITKGETELVALPS